MENVQNTSFTQKIYTASLFTFSVHYIFYMKEANKMNMTPDKL